MYRAHDPRLNRDVAIKVSGEKFSERFTREARTIASLNHTNICHLYDVGPDYLVMEYVEGEDLKGPMEFADALPILEQLIDGIEAAHEKNVIHRDLKPANVKITPEGIVKILDFGLAKAMEPVSSDPENSPTLTMGGTQAGTILGTAAYMSPEQAKGKVADKRADVWSFGVVLHEVLTGKKLFPGDTVVEILGGVLNKEPDLSAAPVRVRKLLGWCLEKDRKHRLASISDARRLLRESGTESPAQAESLPHKNSILPWVVAGVATLALVGTAFALWPKAPELKPLVRLDLELNPPPTSNLSSGPTVVISPDGSRLVWVAENKLFTRRLDETESREIPGTETGNGPFFSPDGLWIGFRTASQLKKVSVDGGNIVNLAPSSASQSGASWGDNGDILYSPQSSGWLMRVSAAGGKVEPAFPPNLRETDAYQLWPQVLPGSKAVLIASGTTAFALGITEVGFAEGNRKLLVPPKASNPRYLASSNGLGYLLYMSGTSLFATRFDPGRMEVQGEPAPVLDRVLVGTVLQAPAQFDVSRSGTAVFRRGESAGGSEQLFWVDGSGKKTPLLAKSVIRPKFSPDGNRIAVEISQNIWVYEWQRDTSIRLTTDRGQGPVWTPDGKFIFYTGNGGIFWTRSDGASQPQLLLSTQTNIYPWSVSPDGKHLSYMDVIDGLWHLFTVPIEINGAVLKAGKPEVFLKTAADERYPSFSPDGRWLAYTSNQSGTYQVHVRPFPDRGGQWQVSSSGGTHPEWGRDGKTLFFRSLEQKIMAVDYAAKGDAFQPERPRVWSEVTLTDQGMLGTYTMHPDSKRMAAVLPAELADGAKPDTHVTILFNFLDELRRKVK